VSYPIWDGKIIRNYDDDNPYPSYLIFGKTDIGRPIHSVIAYAEEFKTAFIITVYEPDPGLRIDYERRII
jgi:hypothetical protein